MRAEALAIWPWRQQAILGRGDWDAETCAISVRDMFIEHLADDDAVLVIDETGFLKQETRACGEWRAIHWVAGQDHETLPDRRVRCYVSRTHASATRTGLQRNGRDPDRIEGTHTLPPPRPALRPKPKAATRMIARAIAASVRSRGLLRDVYGVGDIERQLRRAARDKYWGSAAGLMISILGQAAIRSAGTRRHSPRPDCARPMGNACRRDGTKGPRPV